MTTLTGIVSSARKRIGGAAMVGLLIVAGAGTARAQDIFDPQSVLGPFVSQGSVTPTGLTAISGNTALVSAAGVVHVFERDPAGDTWSEVAQLTASDNGPGFGQAVAVDGETAIVGAQGAAYLFARAASWQEVARLVSGGAAASFGAAVAIDGAYAVVGAPGSGTTGAAEVFKHGSGGAADWQEIVALHAPTSGNFTFGAQVAISGDTAVASVTAPAGGGAYIFERQQGGADNWGLAKRLPDTSGFYLFMRTVDLSGDTIVIAGGDVQQGPYAFIFDRNQDGTNAWGDVAVYTKQCCAFTAKVSGDTVTIVSAFPPSSFVETLGRNQGGQNVWGRTGEFHVRPGSTDPNGPRFTSVSISGDTLLMATAGPGANDAAVQIAASDVDGDGVRDGRDACVGDPSDSTSGNCQQDASAFAVVNDLITQGEVTTATRPGEFAITVTFANAGESAIRTPFFEVTALSEGHRLLNNDGGEDGVGATLTPDVGDGVLQPGESMTATFVIGFESFDAFQFEVDVRGAVEP